MVGILLRLLGLLSPQIASRVRPFNSEERKAVVEKKKEKKECREAATVTSGDGHHGDPSRGPQNAIFIPYTIGDIKRAVFDTAHFERELLSPLPLTPGGVKGLLGKPGGGSLQSPTLRLLRTIGLLRCGAK